MSVKIGHASLAEGGGVYGQPGDQTGREVCVTSWYPKGWQFIAVHPDPAVREKHARAVEAACRNDCVGYSQDSRNSLYAEARKLGMDIARITAPCSCDCSSLQNCCAVASGAPGVSYGSNGWVTTNMLPALRAAGYAIVTDPAMLRSEDYALRGAIYVSAGHTVCALEDGSRARETLEAAGLPADPPAGTDAPDEPGPPADEPAGDVSGPDTVSLPALPAGWSYVPLPTLRKGAESEAVRAAQLLLRGRGFWIGPDGADGELGGNTESAVGKFQRSRYLEQDGVVGPETWGRLIRDAPGPREARKKQKEEAS